MDDMGWRDVGFMGNKFVETPNIDRLAAKGSVFSQAAQLRSDAGFAKDAYFDQAGNYLSDRLTDEVIGFMEQSREKPFFVYYADHAVDNPAYAATIEAVDDNVGKILAAIERLKLTDNTYVIFTSDNGGSDRDTSPLRGGKGQLYEGGVRVPLAILGPHLKKPGSFSAAPVASIDLYPTFLELAGIKLPPERKLDGISLVPALRGEMLQR